MEAHSTAEMERQERNRVLWDAQTRAEDAAAQKDFEQKLAKLLTPAELERWQLEHSQTATQLQSDLEGLRVSEDEYRKLFAIRDRFGDTINNYSAGDEETSQKASAAAAAAQEKMKAEIVAALGETRAKEVERNEDYEYQHLRRLAERNQLPAETAGKIFDLKDTAEAGVQKLEDNSALTDEQRAAAQKAIRAETEKAILSLLGETAFKKFLRNRPSWLSNLGGSGPSP